MGCRGPRETADYKVSQNFISWYDFLWDILQILSLNNFFLLGPACPGSFPQRPPQQMLQLQPCNTLPGVNIQLDQARLHDSAPANTLLLLTELFTCGFLSAKPPSSSLSFTSSLANSYSSFRALLRTGFLQAASYSLLHLSMALSSSSHLS